MVAVRPEKLPVKGQSHTMNAMTRVGYYFEDLQVGMEATMRHAVLEPEVIAFAEVSGDRNPVHLDPEFAASTPFGGCITHGMLTASYISAVFGMELPGPGAIYVSQSLNFKGPVRVGDTVLTKVVVAQLFPAKRRVLFDCTCTVEGKVVLAGEAVMMVPARPVFVCPTPVIGRLAEDWRVN
jgi:3-hydroxybutyryl-CoA dehydratase